MLWPTGRKRKSPQRPQPSLEPGPRFSNCINCISPATLVFLIGIHGVTWLKSVTWWGQLYHYDFVEIGTSNYHTFTQARLNHTFQYMCESFKRPWRAILSCRCDKLQICLKAFEVGLLIFGLLPKRRVPRCFLRCIVVWNVFSMMFSWCYFIQHSITYFLITSTYGKIRIPVPSCLVSSDSRGESWTTWRLLDHIPATSHVPTSALDGHPNCIMCVECGQMYAKNLLQHSIHGYMMV